MYELACENALSSKSFSLRDLNYRLRISLYLLMNREQRGRLSFEFILNPRYCQFFCGYSQAFSVIPYMRQESRMKIYSIGISFRYYEILQRLQWYINIQYFDKFFHILGILDLRS